MAKSKLKVTAAAPWAGANRLGAELVGKQLAGCEWVGVIFCGGAAEIPHITARSLAVNDMHLNMVNLLQVMADRPRAVRLKEMLQKQPFHPRILSGAQAECLRPMPLDSEAQIVRAANYFIAVWMSRSDAGSEDELKSTMATRFTASGGSSIVRYQSAVEGIDVWTDILVDRCEFTAYDFRVFLAKCHNRPRHGYYADPPWVEEGDIYRHKFTERDHRELAKLLNVLDQSTVVVRHAEHPLYRELYSAAAGWKAIEVETRNRGNKTVTECLFVRNVLAG